MGKGTRGRAGRGRLDGRGRRRGLELFLLLTDLLLHALEGSGDALGGGPEVLDVALAGAPADVPDGLEGLGRASPEGVGANGDGGVARDILGALHLDDLDDIRVVESSVGPRGVVSLDDAEHVWTLLFLEFPGEIDLWGDLVVDGADAEDEGVEGRRVGFGMGVKGEGKVGQRSVVVGF